MHKDQVPQDRSRTYAGHKKVLYAVNESGRYEQAPSSGWESEEQATLMAVNELERLAAEAHRRARQGLAAPLEYHMYNKRYDVAALAQASGFFKWQVRRHLKPAVFHALPVKKLDRYAQALGLEPEEVRRLPELKTDE